MRGTTVDGVLQNDGARLDDRLIYFARRWYGLTPSVAEDLVQSALLTMLEVRGRYPEAEHPHVLLGIFRNKCREHIDRRVRAARRLRTLQAAVHEGSDAPPAVSVDAKAEEGVLDELVQRENGGLILEALAELRPKAREMFRLIEEGVSREELSRRYGLNKNTLDSRLHTYRKELRTLLARRGVER